MAVQSKQQYKKLTPTLRFPEFSGEWVLRRLDEIGTNIIGLTYSPKDITTKVSYPIVLRSSNIKDNAIKLEDIVRVKTPIPNKLKVKKGDILICTRNGSQRLIGKSLQLTNDIDNLTFGAFMSVYRSDKNDLNTHIFKTDRYYKQVQRNLGARINQITTKYLNAFSFYFPTQEQEQQKIASFLTSVDDWIENLKKQKKAQEKYKKGMMQKIFSQEIRFKKDDGSDYPEWEKKRLKNVFQRQSNRNSVNQERFVLTNSAIQGIVSQFGYFDKDIANQGNLTNYYVVDMDDFIYNPRISKYAPVGPLKRNKLKKGIMSPLYTVLKAKKGNLTFLEKYFDTTYWHKYMFKIANYGARHDRMNILQDDFMNMPIPFPKLEEQRKIADFLSSIDDLINITNQRITQAEKWKKGVMQKMFI